MSKISMLGFNGLGLILNSILDPFIQLFYQLYFVFTKAIAWTLDMITQLFFIFGGMTPVSSTTKINESTGEYVKNDILNMFIQDKAFTKAYFWLCIIALGLVIVFTIGKIIKQDYFDRSGPRSKAPIFRSVFLSFIAFICVIPVFMFLLQAAGALAMLVMRVLGYKGGGVGTLVFNMSWDDNGMLFRSVAETYLFNDVYDPQNFGWIDNPMTFYNFFWDPWKFELRKVVSIGGQSFDMPKYYWWLFMFTGLILIVNLGKMMLAMVSRLYKLIALFIVAPSPISQIVLDDGLKFKKWKDMVIQEALKIVGCVMCFLVFMIVASAIPDIDFMRYAFNSPESATAISLIEGNSLTTELSDTVNSLYYSSTGTPNGFDNAMNALARCMLLVAGVGAIQDMDSVITPLISGGVSSMDMGHAGGAVVNAGMAAAKGAWELGKLGAKAAVSLGSMAAGAAGAAGAGGAAKGIGDALGKDAAAGAAAKAGEAAKGAGEAAKGAGEGLGKPEEKEGAPKPEEQQEGANKPEEQEGAETPTVDEAQQGVDEAAAGVEEAEERQERIDEIDNEIQGIEREKASDPEGDHKEKDEKIKALRDEKKGLEEKPTVKEAKAKHEAAKQKLGEAKIGAQKQKVSESKQKRDDAKKTLDQVKERDQKQKRILGDIENIEKSQSMSENEKQERIAKLDAEYNKLEAEGPKDEKGNAIGSERAQSDYEAAKSAYDQDNRELAEMGGKVEQETAVEATNNGPQQGESQEQQSGDQPQQQSGDAGEQSQESGDQGTQQQSAAGGQSQESGEQSSQQQSSAAGVPSKYSATAQRQKEKAARGVMAGQVAKGITVGYAKYAWQGAKTTFKAGSIIAKTLLQMTGLGKVASGIGAVEKDVAEGVHKTFGKDAKTGKYHTALGAAVGKAKDNVTNWASAESHMNRKINRINAKYDKADQKVQAEARASAATQMMEQGSFNQNIQQAAQMVHDNPDMSTDDLLNVSQNMIDNSQQMSAAAQAGGQASKEDMEDSAKSRRELITAQRHLEEARGTDREEAAREAVKATMGNVAKSSDTLNSNSGISSKNVVKPKKMARIEKRIAKKDAQVAAYSSEVAKTERLIAEAKENGVDELDTVGGRVFRRNEARLEKNKTKIDENVSKVDNGSVLGGQSRRSTRQLKRKTEQAKRIGDRIARVTARKQAGSAFFGLGRNEVSESQIEDAKNEMEEEYKVGSVTQTKKQTTDAPKPIDPPKPPVGGAGGVVGEPVNPNKGETVINAEVEVEVPGKTGKKSAVKPESQKTLVKNKPNARTNHVINVKTATKIAELADNHVISDDLASAYYTGFNNQVRKHSAEKNALFVEKVNSMSIDSEVHMNEQQLKAALENVVRPATYEDGDDADYRNDVESRYIAAKQEYRQKIEEAKQHVQMFSSSGDVTSLKAAREAIAAAVDKSMIIRDIKIEIDNNKK